MPTLGASTTEPDSGKNSWKEGEMFVQSETIEVWSCKRRNGGVTLNAKF